MFEQQVDKATGAMLGVAWIKYVPLLFHFSVTISSLDS
jgi:hypothetical protein